MGAAGEGFRRSFGATNDGNDRSLFLSDSNLQTLVSKLSRMRGAALKFGQMISFQGEYGGIVMTCLLIPHFRS
jgi:aarF domain-containing kinase